MTDEHTMKLTDFDYLTGDHHLQMIKAALPYVNVPQQRLLSFLVKFWELQKTMSLFQEEQVAAMGISAVPEDQKSFPLNMIKAMEPYGSPQEQDFIQRICNFIQGMRSGGPNQEAGSSQSAFGSALPVAGLTDSLTSGTVSNGTIPSDVTVSDAPLPDNETFSHSQPYPARSPLEQLKGFLPPDQQMRIEQAAFLMQTLQQLS